MEIKFVFLVFSLFGESFVRIVSHRIESQHIWMTPIHLIVAKTDGTGDKTV